MGWWGWRRVRLGKRCEAPGACWRCRGTVAVAVTESVTVAVAVAVTVSVIVAATVSVTVAVAVAVAVTAAVLWAWVVDCLGRRCREGGGGLGLDALSP